MSNPNDPAFPFEGPLEYFGGMTIRQQFVMALGAGAAANPAQSGMSARHIAEQACELADACIAEEARTRKP